MAFENRYKPLLSRRNPRNEIVIGNAYVIHARNGGVGVAVKQGEQLGYRLHREKFGSHFLFVEIDWEDDPKYGTAIPLSTIVTSPPQDDDALLGWLSEQEAIHREEIEQAWEVILGFRPSKLK